MYDSLGFTLLDCIKYESHKYENQPILFHRTVACNTQKVYNISPPTQVSIKVETLHAGIRLNLYKKLLTIQEKKHTR